MIASATAHVSHAAAPIASQRLARLLATSLALGVAVLGTACSDDDDPAGLVVVEGVFASDTSVPAPATGPSPGSAVAACELDLDEFVLVQYEGAAALLHGIGPSGGGGVIPADVTDDDELVFDFVLENDGLGNTVTVVGTVDVLAGGDRIVGAIEMQRTGGLSVDDCGPTTIQIAADRSESTLPGPADAMGDAEGDWDVFESAISYTEACEGPTEAGQIALSITIDDLSSGVAMLDVDDGDLVVEADLVDHFFVSSFDEGDDQTLLVLQYRPAFGELPDFLTGAAATAFETEAGLCILIDELAGSRPL